MPFVNIAFQKDASPTGNWNSLLTHLPDGSWDADLIDSTGSSTGIEIYGTNRAASSSENLGINSVGSEAAAWVDQATTSQQVWYVASGDSCEFEFRGLDNSKTYTVQIYGSANSADTKILECSVDNYSTTQTLLTAGNTTEVITLTATPVGNRIYVKVRIGTGSVSWVPFNALRLVWDEVIEVDPTIALDQASCQPGDTITWSSTDFGAVTGASLTDGQGNVFNLTNIVNNGNGTGSADVPVLSNGLSACLFGSGLTFSATDGTDTVTDTINYVQPTGYSLTTLSSVPGSPAANDWVFGLSPAAAVGDQSIENSANIVHASNGTTSVSSSTTYTYYVIDASTGTVTQVTDKSVDPPVNPDPTITLNQSACKPGDTITWTSTDLGTVTGASLTDSQGNVFSLTNITNGANSGSAIVPAMSHGLDACLFESGVTFSATDGVDTVTDAIDYTQPTGYTLTTLASVPGSIDERDWIYNFDTPATVGDQSIENASVTHNADGSTTVASALTYTYYTVDASDGVVSQINKTFEAEGGPLNDVVPDAFSFAAATSAAINQTNIQSNPVTVAGVTDGIDIPVSISGGEYAVSTDGGSTYGAYTSAATNVRLGYFVRVRGNASSNYGTTANVTLTIGGVSGVFSITTVADPGGQPVNQLGVISDVFHASFTGNVPYVLPGIQYKLINPTNQVIEGVINPDSQGNFSISHVLITPGLNRLTVRLPNGRVRAKDYVVT